MPKEAFGGDDDEEPEVEVKKPKLDKFNLSPDVNIRDLFWSIMGSYAATKKPGKNLKELEHDRFVLMRLSLSVISTGQTEHYGLSPRFVSMYSIMMMLDGGWQDALEEFMAQSMEDKVTESPMLYALKRLIAHERYGKALSELIISMVRSRETGAMGLAMIASVGNQQLVQSLKKELIIIARGDIGENQLNAIKALSLIIEDADVKKSLIIVLAHWDAQARLAAAKALAALKNDEDVEAAAKKRLAMETDDNIKKVLKRIK